MERNHQPSKRSKIDENISSWVSFASCFNTEIEHYRQSEGELEKPHNPFAALNFYHGSHCQICICTYIYISNNVCCLLIEAIWYIHLISANKLHPNHVQLFIGPMRRPIKIVCLRVHRISVIDIEWTEMTIKISSAINSHYLEWTGMAISSWPKNSFWKPSAPGLIIPATEGVSLPETKKEKVCISFHADKYGKITRRNLYTRHLKKWRK